MGPPSPDRHVTYAVGILAIIATVMVAMNIKPIPLAAEVSIAVDPAGAEVWVDGKLEGKAPMQVYVNPGQHRFESKMPGYEPSKTIWQNFEDGGSGYVKIKLTPIAAGLQVVSDLASGTIKLDSGAVELLPREGSLQMRMPVSTKSVEVSAAGLRIVAPVEIKPGLMPELNGAVMTTGARVAAISFGPGRAYAEATHSPMDLIIDGKLVTTLVADGREIPALSPGVHRIRLVDGSYVFERPITVTETPGVALLISAEQNVGNLIVNTNVAGAQILLDGAEFRQSSEAGENFIANLRVRTVLVSLRKEGYREVEPKAVTLRKGETVTLEFNLEKADAPPQPPAEKQ